MEEEKGPPTTDVKKISRSLEQRIAKGGSRERKRRAPASKERWHEGRVERLPAHAKSERVPEQGDAKGGSREKERWLAPGSGGLKA